MTLISKAKLLESFDEENKLNLGELKAYNAIKNYPKDYIYVCDEHLRASVLRKLYVQKTDLQKQEQWRSAAYVQRRIDSIRKSKCLVVL